MGSAKGKRSWRRLDVVSRPREPAAQAKDEWVLPTRPWLGPRPRGALQPLLSLLPVYLAFPSSKKVPCSLRIFCQFLYSFPRRLARLTQLGSRGARLGRDVFQVIHPDRIPCPM